ncbi:MAG: putative DNA binding domain-containing protein [Eubacterium sp.]|nr:putative DNA binding domain-containing protein [Eubacterium sp.]
MLLMETRESEILEFKKSTAQLKEAVISLCAMLNKHNKGVVYFGIKDDGTVCGQLIGKRTTADISHEVRNNLKPIPEVSITIETFEDKDLIKVSANGSDTPYSAYGRYYTRMDDSDIYMDSAQLRKFFESKSNTYSHWEEEITPYGIEKVNEDELIRFIRDANDTGRLNYIYRNAEEALNKLNLMNEEGHLNMAGYYLFGNDGPVLLKEVVYPTDERQYFTDLKQFNGNILECIREGLKYIQNNIHYHAAIVGTRREETPEIPVEALKEILINSFAHCRYQKGDYNEISISRSNVRIYNPGSILNDTSPRDFASGKVGSKIRNPLIATVLFKNGLIDAFGTGFDRTFHLCSRFSVNYEYWNDEYGFTFVFKRSNAYDRSDVTGNTSYDPPSNFCGGQYDHFISPRPTYTVKEPAGVYLSATDSQILEYLRHNSHATIVQISAAIGKSTATTHRHLDLLVEARMLERIGSRKTGYWKVQ